jgi:hypothetical protein
MALHALPGVRQTPIYTPYASPHAAHRNDDDVANDNTHVSKTISFAFAHCVSLYRVADAVSETRLVARLAVSRQRHAVRRRACDALADSFEPKRQSVRSTTRIDNT